MSALFPKVSTILSAEQGVVYERVIPVPVERRNHFRTYKKLPPGKPDCLYVSVIRNEEGFERCVAAIYGGHSYVIHYAFNPVAAA